MKQQRLSIQKKKQVLRSRLLVCSKCKKGFYLFKCKANNNTSTRTGIKIRVLCRFVKNKKKF